jgi:NAD+ kinase
MAFMRVFLLGNGGRPGVADAAEQLLPFLRSHCEVVVYDLAQEADLSGRRADMALVLGGDGSILRAARQMGYQQVPVLGINLGKLGFLADLDAEDVRTFLPRIVGGEYRVTRHVMFESEVQGTGEKRKLLGLNDVVIHTGPPFHLMEIDLEIDGELVTRFSGDGLIISTPIGSTAHNLSAGGPILHQEARAFVITPICPHMLTNRSLVDSSSKTYTILVRRGTDGNTLIVDGQELLPLRPQHRVTIRQAPVDFQLVKVPGRSYYQTLRDKLNWTAPPQYRREP